MRRLPQVSRGLHDGQLHDGGELRLVEFLNVHATGEVELVGGDQFVVAGARRPDFSVDVDVDVDVGVVFVATGRVGRRP